MYPLEIERKDIKFRFIKAYKHYALYESVSGGYKTCFGASDLGLIKPLTVYQMQKILNEVDEITSLLS